MITNTELNKKLRVLAINNGLCEQWQGLWQKDWNDLELVNRFYKGIDFYLKTRFIPTDLFMSDVDTAFLRSHGIIVNDTYSLLNPKYAIAIGSSEMTVRINGNHTSVIYATDCSKLTIIAKNNSHVIVHMLDSSSVMASQLGSARVCIINHSETTTIMGENGIAVRQELDYLK